MKFSILTPTKNRREWIPRVAGSVLAQTLEDFEWVVVDVSDEPIKDVLPDDPRIRYLRARSKGPAGDFARALAAAKGQIVTPLADDDELAEDALEVADEAIGDAEWLVAATGIYALDGTLLGVRGGDPQALALTLSGTYWLGGAIYWRRTLSDRVGSFDSEYDGAADFDLYARFAREATPSFSPRVLYHYTDHPGTDSRLRSANQLDVSNRIAAELASGARV